MEVLAAHADGVIALTGCLHRASSQRIVEGSASEARAHLDDLVQAFGPEHVYFEVQRNGLAEQDRANEGIVRIARELGRPLVGTGDVHYLRARTTTTTPRCCACRRSARSRSRR